jgi:hypothetical protein
MIHQLRAEGPIESPLPTAMLVTGASRCVRAAILASCRTAYPRSVETAWLANKTAQNIAAWLAVAQHDAFFFLRGEIVEGVALVARQRHFELICVHPEVQRLGVQPAATDAAGGACAAAVGQLVFETWLHHPGGTTRGRGRVVGYSAGLASRLRSVMMLKAGRRICEASL